MLLPTPNDAFKLACPFATLLCEHCLQFHSCSPKQRYHFSLIAQWHCSQGRNDLKPSVICCCEQSAREIGILARHCLPLGHHKHFCHDRAVTTTSSSQRQAGMKATYQGQNSTKIWSSNIQHIYKLSLNWLDITTNLHNASH